MKRPAPSDLVRGDFSYAGWALHDDGNPVGGRGACVGDLARIPFEEGAGLLREAGKRLRAVYVGGGTPTALNEDQLTRLLEKLMTLFPGAGEYTCLLYTSPSPRDA